MARVRPILRGDITDDGAEIYPIDAMGRIVGEATYLRDAGDVESRITAAYPDAAIHYRSSESARSFVVTLPE